MMMMMMVTMMIVNADDDFFFMYKKVFSLVEELEKGIGGGSEKEIVILRVMVKSQVRLKVKGRCNWQTARAAAAAGRNKMRRPKSTSHIVTVQPKLNQDIILWKFCGIDTTRRHASASIKN